MYATELCPIHGPQPITGSGTFGPAWDPYGAIKLACGHFVSSFGGNDPLFIVKARDDKLRRYE